MVAVRAMVAMRSLYPSTRRLLPAFIVGWVSGIRIRVVLQGLERNPTLICPNKGPSAALYMGLGLPPDVLADEPYE